MKKIISTNLADYAPPDKYILGMPVSGHVSDEMVTFLNQYYEEKVETITQQNTQIAALKAEVTRLKLANDLADELRVAIGHLVQLAFKKEAQL